ncbi:hypothetical protein CF70_034130 [Cupriavidus sp. SK-3]|uniref:hypothetical protein n=1 Tax=Cupriavidus sp. SK-3 TaxID=1470558 RepID=UPI00044C587C|nr:hypothetical protein [Cupriavidus sp. SK-3]KDP87835.1 hypothetical protein CF70_034130 [Cupriavidus sp. SK-3]
MAEIVHFAPRTELDAEANLLGFIDVCRNQLTVFGANLPFDADVWDVTEALQLKARNGAIRLVFSTWDTANDRDPLMMPEPFLSFAKGYMRYWHALRPTKIVGSRLAALRALEAAISEGGRQFALAQVSPETLHRAAQLIQDKFSAAVAYRVAGQLEMVSDFLVKGRLTAVPVRWRNPIPRPRDSVRVGKEFDDERQAKLPSPTALAALANAFHLAFEPIDVLVSSIAAVLCSAPDRVNEVLRLEVDCEVTQTSAADGQSEYGLRWRPSKGADPMVKWVVRSMVDIVKEAVGNIRKLTETARDVAIWCEQHPGQMYLPAHLEHLRGRDRLSMPEMLDVLFTDSEHLHRLAATNWCHTHGIRTEGARGKLTAAFADIEQTVLAMLPRGFPIASEERNLKYSALLCLVQRNALHRSRATYRGVFYCLQHQDISDGLGGRTESGFKSLFDRLGLTEDDGSPIRIRTHQFRHYLNTLAQAGGLSQLDIAKWSGRVNVSQNRAYDHQSDRDVLALVRQAVGDERHSVGALARLHKATLIPRDEFARLKVPTAHTTEFGYCIHDFAMLPCQLHQDCLNCDEQVCIKGDAVREANLRRHRDETRILLATAEAAVSEELAGADRWREHQRNTLERLDQLCGILDDPRVPFGTVIQPSGVMPASRLEQTAERRQLRFGAKARSPGQRRLPPPVDTSEGEATE